MELKLVAVGSAEYLAVQRELHHGEQEAPFHRGCRAEFVSLI
jgi:hypothetical protein